MWLDVQNTDVSKFEAFVLGIDMMETPIINY